MDDETKTRALAALEMTARFMAALPIPIEEEGHPDLRARAERDMRMAQEAGAVLHLVGDLAAMADLRAEAAIAAAMDASGMDPEEFDPEDPAMLAAMVDAAQDAGVHWSQYLRETLPVLYPGSIEVMGG